jgi:hypothetical protein
MNNPFVCCGILSEVKRMISIQLYPVNENRTRKIMLDRFVLVWRITESSQSPFSAGHCPNELRVFMAR